MNSTRQIDLTIFHAACKITIFALLIQINFCENLNQNSITFRNEPNNISYTPKNQSSLNLNQPRLSDESARLQIIQNQVIELAEILRQYNYEISHRYKRGSVSPPPTPSSNSSNIVRIQNIITKFQEELALLNTSSSLSVENKSKIGVLELMLKEQQTNLDNLLKDVTENDNKKNKELQEMAEKLKTTAMNGIVQSILSRQFSFAEDQLRLYDYAKYKNEFEKELDHRDINFDLLLKFSDSIQDSGIKFKAFEVLHDEMKTDGYKNIHQILLQLNPYIRKELLELSTGTIKDKYQSLNRSLWENMKEPVTNLISFTFLNHTNTQNWKMLEEVKDEIRKSCGLKFLSDVYNKMIEKIRDTDDIFEILIRTEVHQKNVQDQTMIHKFIMNKLERDSNSGDSQVKFLYTYGMVVLTRYMKQTWNSIEFNDTNLRNQYMFIINRLPSSLKNIVLSSSLCIKHSKRNEYLNPAEFRNETADYREVYTSSIPSNRLQHESPGSKWTMRIAPFQITTVIRNVKYDEYLSPVSEKNEDILPVGMKKSPTLWHLYAVEGGVRLSSESLHHYLFIYNNISYNNDKKRSVYTSLYEKALPQHGSIWEFVDCSNFS